MEVADKIGTFIRATETSRYSVISFSSRVFFLLKRIIYIFNSAIPCAFEMKRKRGTCRNRERSNDGDAFRKWST